MMLCEEKFEFSVKNILLLLVIIAIASFYVYASIVITLKDNAFSRYFKGSDYKILLNGSSLIKDGKSSKLYDLNYYKDFLEKHKQKKEITPNYPPIFYFLYMPATYLPIFWGIFINSILFIFLYIISVFLLILTFKRLYKYGLLIILAALIFPPFVIVILNGHPSVLWVFFFSASFYFAKKDKPFIAGLFLSLFILKPSFFILVFIILLFSFRFKIFSGLLAGSAFLIFASGIFDGFHMWGEWFALFKYLSKDVFDRDTLIQFSQYSKRIFFYPIEANIKVLNLVEYAFMIFGLLAIIFPIIYSYNHKKTFSRNSFWFIFPISIVLASPYLYKFELIILLLPIIIFFNLMLADRVLSKYIFLMLFIVIAGITASFVISDFVHLQLFALILWFFLINGSFGKRIREFAPKNFITYWDNY